MDNPELTARNWKGKNPIRIVLDKNLKLKSDLNIFNNHAETIIIADNSARGKTNQISTKNTGINFVNFNKDIGKQLFEILYTKNIQSIIIEGGSKTLSYFIINNIWDEARVFISTKKIINGVKAPIFNTNNYIKDVQLNNSKLLIIKNNNQFL